MKFLWDLMRFAREGRKSCKRPSRTTRSQSRRTRTQSKTKVMHNKLRTSKRPWDLYFRKAWKRLKKKKPFVSFCSRKKKEKTCRSSFSTMKFSKHLWNLMTSRQNRNCWTSFATRHNTRTPDWTRITPGPKLPALFWNARNRKVYRSSLKNSPGIDQANYKGNKWKKSIKWNNSRARTVEFQNDKPPWKAKLWPKQNCWRRVPSLLSPLPR